MSVSPPSIQFSPSLNRKQEVSNRPTEMGVDGPHSSMRRCWLAGSSVSPPISGLCIYAMRGAYHARAS